MAITAEEFSTFEGLVRGTAHAELKCQVYLQHALGFLCRGTPVSVAKFEQIRGHTGDADYFVVADIKTDDNETVRRAFVWELKAPQAHLFELDANANRYRPTIEFIKAENQLLHYTEEARGNETIRRRFGVERDNIRPGGIIIGTEERLLRSSTDSDEVWKARNSLKMRQKYLYGGDRIRVLVWDVILDLIRPDPPQNPAS